MRYLLISNLYNEEQNVNGLFDSVESQTLPPALWLVVDDGSTDGTYELLEEQSGRSRLEVRIWRAAPKPGPDYDTIGVSIKNALHSMSRDEYESFDYFCVLDADSRVGPEYFSELLSRMEQDSKLGMASGTVWTRDGPERTRRDMARGSGRATKGAIWRSVPVSDLPDVVSDAFFNAKTKMLGYESMMFADLRVNEERPTTQMTASGRYRRGRLMAMFWYNPLILLAHVFSQALQGQSPFPLVKGYVAGLRGKRIGDPDVKKYFSRRILVDSLKQKLF